MPKVYSNYFFEWYEKNQTSLKNPFFERLWDDEVGKPEMQKSISSAVKAHEWYVEIEQYLINEQMQLLENKLLKAFKGLNREDLSNPVGFSIPTKASSRVEHYFKVRQTLEMYIRQDIEQHHNKTSSLSAFRRWFFTAHFLFNKNSYEGFLLVMAQLFYINLNNHFQKALPYSQQEQYNKYVDLISPSQDFKKLREHINEHRTEKDFLAVFLAAGLIYKINEAVKDTKSLMKKVDQNEPRFTQLAKHKYELKVKKEQILEGMIQVKALPQTTLTDILEDKFARLTHQFELKKVAGKRFFNREAIQNKSPYVLHKQSKMLRGSEKKSSNKMNDNDDSIKKRLLPSLFVRHGRSGNNWKKAFSIGSTVSYHR